jgi:hypothetical protein
MVLPDEALSGVLCCGGGPLGGGTGPGWAGENQGRRDQRPEKVVFQEMLSVTKFKPAATRLYILGV